MVVKICNRCNQAYSTENNVVDFIHPCSSGNTTLDNEDILVIGDWEDFTGSATIPLGQPLTQGAANKAFGTRAEIEGENIDSLTRRGRRIQTHRQRQFLNFINQEGEC